MTATKLTKVRVEMYFDHSPEKLYDAWLDPENISAWLFSGDKEILSIEMDGCVGGVFCFKVRRQSKEIEHIGKYLKLNRPKLLAFSWQVPFYSKESSTVEIKFEKANAQTKITLVHDSILPEYLEATKKGWTKILNELDQKMSQIKKPHKV